MPKGAPSQQGNASPLPAAQVAGLSSRPTTLQFSKPFPMQSGQPPSMAETLAGAQTGPTNRQFDPKLAMNMLRS